MIAAAHALAARMADLEVGPVASRTTQRADEHVARFGGRRVSYDELPDAAEVVVVCTPPPQHAADALRLLDAGVAVIVEKPLTTTLADADALVTHPSSACIAYAEQLAYAPVLREMFARIGALGPLQHIEVRALQARPDWAGGFFEPAWGGGVLFDLGAHPLAVALLLAAPARPVAVRATLLMPDDLDTDDHGELVVRFDTGLVARVEASWRHGPGPIWDAQAAGASGVLRADILPVPNLEHDGEPVPLAAVGGAVPMIEQMGYLGQLRAFVADFSVGRAPFMDVAFGRLVLDLTCAAYASAGHGGVEIDVPFRGRRDRTPWQLWRQP
jgi:predicted dehydrogenase